MLTDKQKQAKLKVLQEIMDLMEEKDFERLKSKKKPAADAAPDAIAVELDAPSEGDDLDARFQEKQDKSKGEDAEGSPEEEAGESPEEASAEGDDDAALKEQLMRHLTKKK